MTSSPSRALARRVLLASIVTGLVACGGNSGVTAPDDAGTDETSGDSNVGDGKSDAPNDARNDSTTDSSIDSPPSDAPADTTTTDSPPGDSSGKACTATGAECASTEYCDAPTCGSGTCKARPAAPGLDFAPVCGCDGVTYWNASQAASTGASSGATGECSGPSTKTCGGLVGATCPSGDVCVVDLSSSPTCLVSDAGGRCWFVPSGGTCPGGTNGYRDCTTSTCTSHCNAIKSGHSFRMDSGC